MEKRECPLCRCVVKDLSACSRRWIDCRIESEIEYSLSEGDYNGRLTALEAFVANLTPSGSPEIIMSLQPELEGIGSYITTSGYIYDFKGAGALDSDSILTGPNTKYYLLTAEQFPPLLSLSDAQAAAVLWVLDSVADVPVFASGLPLFIDETGIWFSTFNIAPQTIPEGAVFAFGITMVLPTSAISV